MRILKVFCFLIIFTILQYSQRTFQGAANLGKNENSNDLDLKIGDNIEFFYKGSNIQLIHNEGYCHASKQIIDIVDSFFDKIINGEQINILTTKFKDIQLQKEWSKYIQCKILDRQFQGWKIHISATVEHYTEILKALLPTLLDNQLLFKVLHYRHYIDSNNVDQGIRLPSKTDKNHNKIMTKINSEVQLGKFICIYTLSLEHLLKIYNLLEKPLNLLKEKSPFYTLSGDFELGSSGGFFVRYGGFKSDNIIKISQNWEMIPSYKTAPLTSKECVKLFDFIPAFGYDHYTFGQYAFEKFMDNSEYAKHLQNFGCDETYNSHSMLNAINDIKTIPINMELFISNELPKNPFLNIDLKFQGKIIDWENIQRLKEKQYK